jgi:hypothetical protein
MRRYGKSLGRDYGGYDEGVKKILGKMGKGKCRVLRRFF